MTLTRLNELYPCLHRSDGDRCPVCSQPRSLCTAMLHQSLRATDARLTPPDNVIHLRPAGRRAAL